MVEFDKHEENKSTKEQLNNSVKQLNKRGDTRGMHLNSLKNLEKNLETLETRENFQMIYDIQGINKDTMK